MTPAEAKETALNYRKVGSASDDCSLIQIYQNNSGDGDLGENDDLSNPPSEAWLETTVALLHSQWPQIPTSAYREKIVHPSHQLNYNLPCSYILLMLSGSQPQVIGHGRLTECYESAGGNAAAVSYIVIDSLFRAQGWGRRLMKLLEDQAVRMGYHFMYLWTTTAIQFYGNIGYRKCQRVSLKRDCLKSLKTEQVQSLETLLVQKSKKRSASDQAVYHETLLLPPASSTAGDQTDTVEDVWMRKRLVEEVASVLVDVTTRQQELADAVRNMMESTQYHRSHEMEGTWYYHVHQVPWQAQIGPSCGLTALRMVREYFLTKQQQHEDVNNRNTNNDDCQNMQFPSLLGEARDRGFTHDGEVFNANHLQTLAKDICGIESEMSSTRTLTGQEICNLLVNSGSVLILPYDSNPRTRLPTQLSGQCAHYGIVVGMLVWIETETKQQQHDNEGNKVTCTEGNKPVINLHKLESGSGFFNSRQPGIENIFVLVQHSLSIKLSIAPWLRFLQSNQQLVSVDERKFGHIMDLNLKDRVLICRGML